MPNDFRTVARTLTPYIRSVDNLINATDAIVALAGPAPQTTLMTNDYLDLAAFRSDVVICHLREHALINAIKEHRRITQCSLKESKDSCERVRDVLERGGVITKAAYRS